MIDERRPRLQDRTSHKELQAQFLHAQDREAMGRLAGGIAHDVNNILTATLIHLQLLQEKQNLEPELMASLRELEKGTKRAASLAHQLLLFSRREAMRTRRLDLNEVIQGLSRMLRRLPGEDIDMVFHPAPEPVWVEADAGMLEQVVMNLCLNAREAMPRGGRLELGAHRLSLEAGDVRHDLEARPGHFACLTVIDTGHGMDETTLKRVFEGFFTPEELGKSTGLDLATVHRVVDQHHGWVKVESAIGVGTTFRVFLPLAEPPATTHLQADPVKGRSGAETILLVEDDGELCRMIRARLRLSGYEVLEARNGMDALQTWERHRGRGEPRVHGYGDTRRLKRPESGQMDAAVQAELEGADFQRILRGVARARRRVAGGHEVPGQALRPQIPRQDSSGPSGREGIIDTLTALR